MDEHLVNAMRDLSDRRRSVERERDRLQERLRDLRLSLRAAATWPRSADDQVEDHRKKDRRNNREQQHAQAPNATT